MWIYQMVFPFLRRIFFLCRDSSFIPTFLLISHKKKHFFFFLFLYTADRPSKSCVHLGDTNIYIFIHHIRFIGILLTDRELGKRFISYNIGKKQRNSYTNPPYTYNTRQISCWCLKVCNSANSVQNFLLRFFLYLEWKNTLIRH